DLEEIASLGFRGEALASIASVSRITCTTRSQDDETGIRLRLEGGQIVHRASTGRPTGTEMRITDLFYNMPARRKFLRTERTERRHINAFLTRYAIAYPEVAFRVLHEGSETLRTPGNGDPREVLLNVYGLEVGGSLLEIAEELTAQHTIKVRGFVGPTNIHRANRGYITLMINGRWVEDLRITYAIIQAYHTLLPTKRYPIAFVRVEMPPEDVDVNVHPAKTEVRFRKADEVFRAVQRAVRATVIAQAPVATPWQPQRRSAQAAPPEQTLRTRLQQLQPSRQFTLPSSAKQQSSSPALPTATESSAPTAARPTSRATPPAGEEHQPAQLPPLRIIGQVARMFIVAEGPDGLYLIDQHAAHERVLYERMRSAWATGDVPAQPLLTAQTITLPADEAARLEAQLPTLSSLGLQVEKVSACTFKVSSTPAPLGNISPQELLADIASSELERSPVREELEKETVLKICKRAAVKGGQVLPPEEMRTLIQDLEQTRNPRTCPHGRPTILQISMKELASQFGRLG
ncbi:MAG: DNA mismatch repair endonuclease MutL, partial [Anaerolineae bacterium]|nr:DNA mismatch repair endonuclease MutL [Anaerolineae bacterium]